MTKQVLDTMVEKMNKSVAVYRKELASMRAGRANPQLLDRILVDYYGSPTPINQVANISIPEPRIIQIAPWEQSMLKVIEKEIQKSDLGINPTNDGKIIRLLLPELTEERRKELVKQTRKMAEECKIAVRAIAILLALVVDALFIFFVTGLNPLSVYGVMWSGTFANMTRFSWMLRDLSTLLCVGIALAPAFKMRFWNCGGEGQILIGGLTAALIMVYQGNNLPLPLLFAAMALGSIAAGALWGFIPAWFKSRWNTNETLFTLMMNYVATSIVACMTNIMRGQASSLGTLNKATKAGWFPVIMGQRYTINIIVVIVLTFAMYAYLKFSKQGYGVVIGEYAVMLKNGGIKQDTDKFYDNLLDNCDLYEYCPVLWDCSNFYKRITNTISDETLAELFSSRAAANEAGKSTEEIKAAAKKKIESTRKTAE